MQDITQGVERNRAWPRPRGAPKSEALAEQQDWFRQAQFACKFVSPQQMCDVMIARDGTPILPRDVFTCMFAGRLCAFVMPDGRVLYPMAARTDVSQCLDTITQTEGKILIRGAELWEEGEFPSPDPASGPLTCTRTNAALNVTGDGTYWTCAYDTLTDSADFATLDTSTGEVTMTQAGFYHVEMRSRFDGAATGDWCGIECMVNGASRRYWGYDAVNQPAFWPGWTFMTRLQIGDVVTVRSRVGGATKIYDAIVPGTANALILHRIGD